MKIKNFKLKIILLFLVIGGGLLRYYNLNWGPPFYFHPDERNIASAVSQLRFPDQMNPHFFAYGSLPIYAIYFLGILWNAVSHAPRSLGEVGFEHAILISRFFSATLSVMLIPILYFIGKMLKNKTAGLFAAFFATTSVGLIQYAHFGTFEMWLTFFSVCLLYLTYLIATTGKLKWVVLASLTCSILLSIKISSAVLLSLPLIALFFYELKHSKKSNRIKNMLTALVASLLMSILAITAAVLFSPYSVLDFQAFRSSIIYESSVALGATPVFYTQSFYDIPFPKIFQLAHIYPFLLNPLLAIALPIAMVSIVYLGLKKKDIGMLLVFIFFSVLFFSQAFFFAKWARYMIPTLPFAYLSFAAVLSLIFENKRSHIFIMGTIFLSIIYALSFFILVYTREDTRIAASLWAKKNIPQNTKILSEVYDLGILPFNNNFSSITLFDFYNLDKNAQKKDELQILLQTSDYIILPSQRILKSRLTNPKKFPDGYRFYTSLFDGSLGFQKIYETPCDFLCKLVYLGNPVFLLEETTSVFDRPTLFIFKRK